VCKVWKQLDREGEKVARCTVARLMRSMGLQGIVRGRPVKTAVSDRKAPCPLDKVNRQFRAERPNALWLSDFTYVSTWQGFVYVAFVIDAFARRIVGWRASRTAHAGRGIARNSAPRLGYSAEEVVVVPGGCFLFDFEAGLIGDVLDEVESGVFDRRHVGGPVLGAKTH
jgi:hypothetical protein